MPDLSTSPTPAEAEKMTSGDIPGEPGSWLLARMINPVPEKNLPASIIGIRPLSVTEHHQVTAAEEVFNLFGPNWPHTRAVHFAQALGHARERLEDGKAKANGAVNESDLTRVSGALRNFATCVSEWLAAAASGSDPVSHAASVAVMTAPVMLCERIAGGEIPTLMANDESRISVRFYDGVQVDAIGLALGGLAACEPLAETELVETEPSLLSAGALIMGLRAEVVWGEPALVHSQELHLGKMDITPQPIEWRRVEPVLTACAIARAALAQRSGTTAPVIVAKGSPPSDSSTVDSEAVGNDVPNSPEEGSSAESLSVGPSAEPADLAAFLREVVSIAQTTEQRWSEALGAAVGDDVGDLVAKGRSLLAALGRQVIQEDGAGPVLPGIPLTPATANGLSVMPEGAQREIQHAIAVVQVLAELALAIEALRRPTGLRITLPEGTVTSWWTQHGFNHVQYRAEMATRVVMQDASDPSADRARMGLLAQAAWTAGLPEAAIVYLVGTLDPVTEAAGALAGAFASLLSTARTLAMGDRVSLDAVVPLARFWLDELERRRPGPPGTGNAVSGST